jgi:NAD(P)H dehydrogenase (quinone)
MSQTLLVTGAAGQLGRLVVQFLLETPGVNPSSIVATTRDPSKLADFAAKGVQVRAADFNQPETLPAAFAGVDRILLISTGDIFVDGQRLGQHKAAVDAAAKAGVKHILYTSVISPKPNPSSIIENDHFWTEQAIMASGMSWTMLRHGLYTDNMLRTLPGAIASGVFTTATGSGPRNWVTREDCARADAAALASTDAGCKIYDITGPEAINADAVVAIIAELTGKPLVHKAIPSAALREGLVAAKLPPTLIGAMVGFDEATALGYYAVVTPAVEMLTGRKPAAVREFYESRVAALLPSQ